MFCTTNPNLHEFHASKCPIAYRADEKIIQKRSKASLFDVAYQL